MLLRCMLTFLEISRKCENFAEFVRRTPHCTNMLMAILACNSLRGRGFAEDTVSSSCRGDYTPLRKICVYIHVCILRRQTYCVHYAYRYIHPGSPREALLCDVKCLVSRDPYFG
eukprot:jgi/Botrbrau1/11323/Bobra.0038s0083.1